MINKITRDSTFIEPTSDTNEIGGFKAYFAIFFLTA